MIQTVISPDTFVVSISCWDDVRMNEWGGLILPVLCFSVLHLVAALDIRKATRGRWHGDLDVSLRPFDGPNS